MPHLEYFRLDTKAEWWPDIELRSLAILSNKDMSTVILLMQSPDSTFLGTHGIMTGPDPRPWVDILFKQDQNEDLTVWLQRQPFEVCLKIWVRKMCPRLEKLVLESQPAISIPSFQENTFRVTIHCSNVALTLLWHWWNTSWSWRHDNMQTKS